MEPLIVINGDARRACSGPTRATRFNGAVDRDQRRPEQLRAERDAAVLLQWSR